VKASSRLLSGTAVPGHQDIDVGVVDGAHDHGLGFPEPTRHARATSPSMNGPIRRAALSPFPVPSVVPWGPWRGKPGRALAVCLYQVVNCLCPEEDLNLHALASTRP
jgi:hypothetical protein